MATRMFGEFMGTMVLILMGNGVVAGVLLRKSKAEDAGWMAITTGWALAVMAGVFTAIACGSPDAHLNPAVTLGVAVSTGDFSKLAPYVAAQMPGAMAGAHAGVAALPAALAGDAGARSQAGLLLHVAGHPAAARPTCCSEIIGHVRSGAGGGGDLLESGGGRRTGRRGWDHTWWAAWCGASA